MNHLDPATIQDLIIKSVKETIDNQNADIQKHLNEISSKLAFMAR